MSVEPNADIATSFDSTIETRDHIRPGETISLTKTISRADVEQFAVASADTNPLHLDESYAKETRFAAPISHGVLVAGVISAALARLPGVVIYLSQNMEFRAPVFIGESVTATCEITEVLDENTYRIDTVVTNEAGTVVLNGGATILVDEAPF